MFFNGSFYFLICSKMERRVKFNFIRVTEDDLTVLVLGL